MPVAGSFQVTQQELDRIKEFSAETGRSLEDIYRTAIVEYVTREQQSESAKKQRDELLAESLKSIENRFGTLLVRLGIDLESMYALAWSLTAEQPDREEMFEKCYEVGVKRFRRKLKGLEQDMVDSLVRPSQPINQQDDEVEAICDIEQNGGEEYELD